MDLCHADERLDGVTHKLECDSIQQTYGGRSVLGSIYVASETGTITGLLGRNGSGKTTLLKIIFGAIPNRQKSVRVNGASLGLTYLSKRLIAYLPQHNLVPATLTLRKACSLFSVDRADVVASFPETADMMDYTPDQLSGGYRRIFELLLILHSPAYFCLLDEPFTGLSPTYIDRIKRLLLDVRKNKGLIVTDHLHREVAGISDRLYVLAEGQTYQVTQPEDLIRRGYLRQL